MEKLLHSVRNLFNIHLTDAQILALGSYEKELLEWNQKFNLTAIRDVDGIRTKHFLDSFSCALAWGETPPSHLADVGTGAGFPGLPLKILYPAMRLTLVESVGKKVSFCKHIVDTLKLEGVEVVHARAEDVGQNPKYRQQFDWAVGRAVANLPVLCEYLLPLVKVGGTMLAQKGDSGRSEADSARNAIQLLGGELRNVINLSLPAVPEPRTLVLVDKIASTPAQYPRQAGTPSREPF